MRLSLKVEKGFAGKWVNSGSILLENEGLNPVKGILINS